MSFPSTLGTSSRLILAKGALPYGLQPRLVFLPLRRAQELSQSCSGSRGSPQIRPMLAELGETFVEFGRIRATFENKGPMRDICVSKLAKFDQNAASFCQCWSNLANFDKRLALIGHFFSDVARVWPNSANVGPNSASFGRIWAESGPNPGRIPAPGATLRQPLGPQE